MRKITAMILSVCLTTISILNVVTENSSSSSYPVAEAGPDQNVNESQVIYFNGSSSYDPDGFITTYNWDFDADVDSDGDNNKTNDINATGPTPTHVYDDDGEYYVTLTVIDDEGLSDTDTLLVIVENIAPNERNLLVNGNFSDGLNGWNQSLHGYVRPNSIPPLPPSQHSTSTNNGYLETRVFNGYNQLYQDVKVNTTDLDFHAKFRAVSFSTAGGLVDVKVRMFSAQPPGWSGNPPNISNLSLIQSLIVGQISWYFRPDHIYLSTNTSYWELLGTGPSDWYILDVNLHDVIVAHLPEINESQVKWLRIWLGTYGESGGFTIGNFDDLSLRKSIITCPNSVYEGDELIFTARASDPGSDDLIFTWDWGDGSSPTVKTYYNDGTGPDPYPSPEGKYPFTATDSVMHTYGDDGVFTITLIVSDDDGGFATYMTDVIVNNVAPTIGPIESLTVDEGVLLNIDATAYDPGSDDLTFTWDWGDGTSDVITIYYNNGFEPDPYPSPWGTFPFNATDTVQHIYYNPGVYILHLTVEDDDGGVAVYTVDVAVNYIAPLPPILYINVSQDGKDVILFWDQPSAIGIDHYLIYRSKSQTNFDFYTVWKNTLIDMEQGELDPTPLRTMWNDTNAAFPGNKTNYEEQFYYIIRAVGHGGWVSRTSRTVGKWTKIFPQGISTFSLPLKTIVPYYTDYYTSTMSAEYIRYIDPDSHTWHQHNLGEGTTDNTLMKLGEGYEVKFSSMTNYTFCGLPGAMIGYDDDTGFSGFDHATEAKSLKVIIDQEGNVILTWQEPECMSNGWYEVYYSQTRDGFFGMIDRTYSLVGSPVNFGNSYATHFGAMANDPSTRLYYMVVPFNESGVRGSSTYSIGIWTEEYLPQYDTFGIPLKININKTADWYCDEIPNTVGINYYIQSYQRWCWHSKRMSSGAYDPLLMMTKGYQISTSSTTKFTFIGI
ncbi:MAG: PKD domain-containing protein [Thermoplasmata archaeon]|nr:MAG: PKD domain-containing protein [Thermoplasmata archaeon]